MFDRLFNRFTLGFGVGYVLGARAGRERYEELRSWWQEIIGNASMQETAGRALGEFKRTASMRLRERMGPQTIREVMTPSPRTVRTADSIAEAARVMRDLGVGSIIVVDDNGRVTGIVTDRDVAIRAVALGLDPNDTPVGEIASKEQVVTISPDDRIDRAVQLMRERAIRRLPVVEGDRPVGIVSIGDLALERDPRSALADISSDQPNL